MKRKYSKQQPIVLTEQQYIRVCNSLPVKDPYLPLRFLTGHLVIGDKKPENWKQYKTRVLKDVV